MIAVGYSRVSTELQTESGLGLESQEEKIRNYCQLKGMELRQIYRENCITGTMPLRYRPEGKKMWEEKNIDSIVIVRLDRAFRNAVDAMTSAVEFRKRKIALHIIDMGGNSIDTNTAIGELFFNMLAAFAQAEVSLIRERTLAALTIKRKRQEKLGGKEPFGYSTIERNGKKILVKNENEYEILSLINTLHKKGYSSHKIAKKLNEARIPSKSGISWSRPVIWKILKRFARESLLK
jgi:DNA invertase Pin-like site-specific DNA recombinase